MELIAIAAVAANRVIGLAGDIPWSIPEDWKRFKAVTMGSNLIMGRVTFEAIGDPLPGRTSIVITRNPPPGATPAAVARAMAEPDEARTTVPGDVALAEPDEARTAVLGRFAVAEPDEAWLAGGGVVAVAEPDEARTAVPGGFAVAEPDEAGVAVPGDFAVAEPDEAPPPSRTEVIWVTSLEESLAAADPSRPVYVAGGAEIYRLAWDRLTRLDLTEVDLEPEGDALFPEVDPIDWVEVSRDQREGFAFVEYRRRP